MFYMGAGTRALFVSQASRDMSVFFCTENSFCL